MKCSPGSEIIVVQQEITRSCLLCTNFVNGSKAENYFSFFSGLIAKRIIFETPEHQISSATAATALEL